MGLTEIRAGLVTAFEGVTGIGPVLGYPPKSIPANYTLYLVRSGFETVPVGRQLCPEWSFTARLVILWQDAEQAEKDLDSLTRAIMDAVNDDTHLGTAIGSGRALIVGGEDGWFQLENSASWYRYCDFDITVLDKTVV